MRTKSIILLLLFLISCAPQISETPSSASTVVPSVTAVILNTPTVLPTATKSVFDKIFILPTRGAYFTGTTPTPIATPISNNLSVKLKDLSEEDYINWIKDLQDYSYRNYPPALGWYSEGFFSSSQAPLALVIQEYLYHYPDSPNAERLKWQLALIDSVTFTGGNIYDNTWIIAELQRRLNQGETLPAGLESLLDKYWFDVEYYQPIVNLFGGGETSWLYVIGPQLWADEEDREKTSEYFSRGGIFIIVREVDKGKFQLYLLENTISISFSDSYLYEISDHNQNDVPEIALYIGSHSGTMCGGNLKIFEWKQNSFLELTKNQVKISDCMDGFQYLYNDDVPAIMLNKSFFYPKESLYIWDGDYYQIAYQDPDNLLFQWRESFSNPSVTFEEEAALLQKILSAPDRAGLDDAHVDFLTYRLGMVYALMSKESQAKEILKDLAENPADTNRTIYSDISKLFLRYYVDQSNLPLACEHTKSYIEKPLGNFDYKKMDELFGVPFDEFFGFADLRCYDWQIFEKLINNASVTEDVSALLSNSRIPPKYIEKLDINLDGKLEEWIVVYDSQIYLVVPKHPKNKFVRLETLWNASLSARSPQILDIKFFSHRWVVYDEIILSFQIDDELIVLSIDENYQKMDLDDRISVKNANFYLNENPARYEVVYIKPSDPDVFYPNIPWEGFRWDTSNHEFRADLFEYTIFVERNTQKSITIAEKLLSMLYDWRNFVDRWSQSPRYYYLCALSYELAGDSQKAAEIYWQLWRDFPESQYALLARYKLEPVSP